MFHSGFVSISPFFSIRKLKTDVSFHPKPQKRIVDSKHAQITKFSFANSKNQSPAKMVKMLATKAEFDECLKNNKKVVIDFTASWCGPCQMIGPKFVAMSESGEFGNVTFVKVNEKKNGRATVVL